MVLGNPRGYYSSQEKDIVRQFYDLPLLEAFQRRKQDYLSYFGLPGAEALDLKAWRHLVNYVAAVERQSRSLDQLERLLDTQFPQVRYTTHLGEIDRVIISNRGRRRVIGGQPYQPRVGNSYESLTQGYVWRFDVVNLDYFGPFLPPDAPGAEGRAAERARALRKLFEFDRVDAWQPWILFITVEAQLLAASDEALLKSYLTAAREDSSLDTCHALDFFLTPTSDSAQTAGRVIHGVAAILVSLAASNANLNVRPRGTTLYKGAHNESMIHLAFEFEPVGAPLAGPVSRLQLLRAPILRPMNSRNEPWFELLPEQPPGLTQEELRNCLDFLRPDWVEQISTIGSTT